MEDKRLKSVICELKSMGDDVEASAGKPIPNGKSTVSASSSSTDFTKVQDVIDEIASNYNLNTPKVEPHFLELTDKT